MKNGYWWKQSFFERNFDRLFSRYVQYEDVISFFISTQKLLNWRTIRVIFGYKDLDYSEDEMKILESIPISSQPNTIINLSEVESTWITDDWMALDIPAIVRKHQDLNYDCVHKDLTLFYKKYPR